MNIEQLAAREIAKRESSAAKNRIDFPIAAGFLDRLRAAGFESARITYASENGKTIGKRGEL